MAILLKFLEIEPPLISLKKAWFLIDLGDMGDEKSGLLKVFLPKVLYVDAAVDVSLFSMIPCRSFWTSRTKLRFVSSDALSSCESASSEP